MLITLLVSKQITISTKGLFEKHNENKVVVIIYTKIELFVIRYILKHGFNRLFGFNLLTNECIHTLGVTELNFLTTTD